MDSSEYSALYVIAGDNWSQSRLRKDQIAVRDYINASFPRNSKVLDVGCSAGDLLSSLHDDYEKFGIEPSEIATSIAKARGINMIGKSFDDLLNAEISFDVITAIDVIEHVPDPLLFLKLLSNKLSPTGKIIIGTGNSGASAWKFMGPSYYYSHNFEHISFISPAWCRFAESIGLRFQQIDSDYRHGDFIDRGIFVMSQKYIRTAVEKVMSMFERLVLMRFPGTARRLGPRICVGEPGIFKDHFLVAFSASPNAQPDHLKG